MPESDQPIERKLAAIFAADVAGYSRLMGQDEVGTMRTLTEHREVMDSLIAQHRGRIANTAGDSVLAEFPSVVDAVKCAAAVQEALREKNEGVPEDRQLRFRIGVHVGDVMVRGADLLGDGVNVAARLQALAEPGGVCISREAHRSARSVMPLAFTDLGQQSVKNVDGGVRAYAVRSGDARPSAPPALPDKPSIAVLPFANMSGDPEQEYFADGIVEEIITSLSRFPRLFVIARNSSFTYKGRAVDVKQVGRELGVRYVLEGSIRKAANRVRIAGQLIDAATGAHLWADRIDGDLNDIFALQDAITEQVVGVIEPRIQQAEIEAAARKRPDSLTAYDLYLRALPNLHSLTRESVTEAVRLFDEAFAIDPSFGAAAARAANARGYPIAQGWLENTPERVSEQLRLARRAVDLDPNDPDALALAARTMSYNGVDFEGALELSERATRACPNSALAWKQRGWVCMYSARPAEAVEFLERAMRLSPRDPMQYDTLAVLAFAYIQLARYEAAAEVARKSVLLNPYFSTALRALTAALAHMDRTEEMQEAVQHLMRVEPNFTIAAWDERSRWRYPAKENMREGLRRAGLPE